MFLKNSHFFTGFQWLSCLSEAWISRFPANFEEFSLPQCVFNGFPPPQSRPQPIIYGLAHFQPPALASFSRNGTPTLKGKCLIWAFFANVGLRGSCVEWCGGRASSIFRSPHFPFRRFFDSRSSVLFLVFRLPDCVAFHGEGHHTAFEN